MLRFQFCILLMLAALPGLPAFAIDRPALCATEAARQFDFWPGTWRVESRFRTGPDSWHETDGKWRAERAVGGCVFIDFAEGDFSGRPVSGMGTRYWDPAAGEWVVTWISTARPGVRQEWRGNFDNGVGNFFSEPAGATGAAYSRLQWRDVTADSADWSFAVTRDGGETWTTRWEMTFVRIPD
ncbi:MAG: DUF1579 family protein [Candidatus Wenzhouxiangella sp. M2_3B_020]